MDPLYMHTVNEEYGSLSLPEKEQLAQLTNLAMSDLDLPQRVELFDGRFSLMHQMKGQLHQLTQRYGNMTLEEKEQLILFTNMAIEEVDLPGHFEVVGGEVVYVPQIMELHQLNQKYGNRTAEDKAQLMLFANKAMYELGVVNHLELEDGKFIAAPGRVDPSGGASADA